MSRSSRGSTERNRETKSEETIGMQAMSRVILCLRWEQVLDKRQNCWASPISCHRTLDTGCLRFGLGAVCVGCSTPTARILQTSTLRRFSVMEGLASQGSYVLPFNLFNVAKGIRTRKNQRECRMKKASYGRSNLLCEIGFIKYFDRPRAVANDSSPDSSGDLALQAKYGTALHSQPQADG